MGIIKKYKIPVEVNYLCDDCGGVVLPTGMVLTSDPLQYQHECSKCGKQYTFREAYPHIVYEDKTIANDMIGSNINLFSKMV